MSFALDDWTGEVAGSLAPASDEALAREIAALTQPDESTETLHWGRNYLYKTRFRSIPVVVKQFRNEGVRRRLDRRFRGSKAQRSWEKAHHLAAAGFSTPEPVAWIESTDPEGPSLFVCRELSGVTELRYLLRAANADLPPEEIARRFPDFPLDETLAELGRLVRRLHEADIWYRDMTSGNVLLEPSSAVADGGDGPPRLWLVDVNRARVGKELTFSERTRDLCRMPIFRSADQERFVAAYWDDDLSRAKRALYHLYHRSFYLRTRTKARLRTVKDRLTRAVLGKVKARTTHAHIPKAPAGASSRDRVVWDHLSDQPHIHAGPLTKLGTRLRDAGSYAAEAWALLRALPRIVVAVRRLRRDLHRRPVPFEGIGVALRPWPEDPEALLAAVDDLGVRHVLVRLHPWEPGGHDAEEALVRSLAERGLEIAFAVPQNRDLVRSPERWREAMDEIARRFTPYGRSFQIGQAINRSKWGVWSAWEYLELVEVATEALRAERPDVEILGPAVIDFELHRTAGIVNLSRFVRRGLRFDALSSLLYVDRRGAPENRQLGMGTVGKVLLARAIAETARTVTSSRSWITEVNWPLWEGPHSPAGRSVSVHPDTQAAYLARFYLLALGTGAVERVYWWQLVARGYGLAYRDESGTLIRRPAFDALATLIREFGGATFLGPIENAPEGVYLYRFEQLDGGETVVGWTTAEEAVEAELPDGRVVRLDASPRYFRLETP